MKANWPTWNEYQEFKKEHDLEAPYIGLRVIISDKTIECQLKSALKYLVLQGIFDDIREIYPEVSYELFISQQPLENWSEGELHNFACKCHEEFKHIVAREIVLSLLADRKIK